MSFSASFSSLQPLLQHLLSSDVPFALYRLPKTDDITLCLQLSKEEKRLSHFADLQGQLGFVFAPFALTETSPLLLIQADAVFTGLSDIEKGCKDLHLLPAADAALATREEILSKEEEQQHYNAVFAQFMDALQQGHFHKLVLSRKSTINLPLEFSVAAAFLHACERYPNMFISLVHTKTSGLWLGSTPEILLTTDQKQGRTMALAGTMALATPEATLPPLSAWSAKNQHEQAVVASYIRKILEQHCSDITETGPYTSQAGLLVHLRTDFTFTLNDNIGLILEKLHPTPAVCGLPKAEAFSFITEHEGYDRTYYAGFIGPMSPDKTQLFVNLRCMQLHLTTAQPMATLYAGGGLLTQSTAESEFAETQFKMNTMRNIF